MARLAVSQLKRMRRIVDAAVELGARGGFDAVRLRDVADGSGVALGTLYNYFRSKEDLLLFALLEEVEGLEQALRAQPAVGRTPLARVINLFERATQGLTRRPPLARALVRAMTVGDADTALKIAALHLRVEGMIVAAMGGDSPRERQIAATLMHVWFSSLVGWSVGVRPDDAITEQVRNSARLLLNGSRERRQA